jgi:hypothetical protein
MISLSDLSPIMDSSNPPEAAQPTIRTRQALLIDHQNDFTQQIWQGFGWSSSQRKEPIDEYVLLDPTEQDSVYQAEQPEHSGSRRSCTMSTPFFDLPREVRDSIYQYFWDQLDIYLVADTDGHFQVAHEYTQSSLTCSGLPSSLLASKAFRDEAMYTLYRTVAFHVQSLPASLTNQHSPTQLIGLGNIRTITSTWFISNPELHNDPPEIRFRTFDPHATVSVNTSLPAQNPALLNRLIALLPKLRHYKITLPMPINVLPLFRPGKATIDFPHLIAPQLHSVSFIQQHKAPHWSARQDKHNFALDSAIFDAFGSTMLGRPCEKKSTMRTRVRREMVGTTGGEERRSEIKKLDSCGGGGVVLGEEEGYVQRRLVVQSWRDFPYRYRVERVASGT